MAEEPLAKRARVHFGSAEEQETKKIQHSTASLEGSGIKGTGGISEAILAGIRAGNINIADGAH